MNRQEVFSQLQRGDIFATTNPGIVGQLHKRLFRPRTTRFHYGLLGEKIIHEDELDWVIFESIGKGVAVGRLSWYLNDDVEVYRVAVQESTDPRNNNTLAFNYGLLASLEATNLGRRLYDFRAWFHIAYYSLKAIAYHLWKEGKAYVHYTDIPLVLDNRLICTELVNESYRPYFAVTDNRFLATPANFKHSVLYGRIRTVAKWRPGGQLITLPVLKLAGG